MNTPSSNQTTSSPLRSRSQNTELSASAKLAMLEFMEFRKTMETSIKEFNLHFNAVEPKKHLPPPLL
jgi:hypothetical protein